MPIQTTHVGSLPRPQDMITKTIKKQPVTRDDLASYLKDLVQRQIDIGLSVINNGELPRSDYIQETVSRIKGFDGTGIAPIPKDLEDLPELSRRFGGRNGLITLNPKAPVTLPACTGELAYQGEDSLTEELTMLTDTFDALSVSREDHALFFTAPSPGTVALFMENAFYPDEDTYLDKLAQILKQEYEIIAGHAVILQVDCPDLAMGRHTRFRHLSDDQFLAVTDRHIRALKTALAGIDPARCRAHVCWGNYPGTHHCDIGLKTIIGPICGLPVRYVSIEACNPRHAHEWEVFKDVAFPGDKVLMPGVIDTTSNTVEHPELVAQRLLNYARILGPERVMASTDCGFASTASATSVSGEVAWLKLKAMVEGAAIASSRI